MIQNNNYQAMILVMSMLMCAFIPSASCQDVDSVTRVLKQRRLLAKEYKQHLRRMPRQEKLIYRRGGRNVRDVVFDFDKKVFINDPPRTQDSFKTPPFEIHEMDGLRINIKNVNPFIWKVDLFELQGDQISNENLRENSQASALTLNVPFFNRLDISSFIVLAAAPVDSGDYKTAVKKQALAMLVHATIDTLNSWKEAVLARIDTIQFEIDNKHNMKESTSLSTDDSLKRVFTIQRLEKEVVRTDKTITALRSRITKEKLDSVTIATMIIRESGLLTRNRTITEANAVKEKLSGEIRHLQDTLQKINQFIFLHNQLVNIGKLSINKYESMDSCVTAMFRAAGVRNPQLFQMHYQRVQSVILKQCDRILYLVQQVKGIDTAAVDKLTEMENDVKEFCREFKAFDHARLVSEVGAIKSLVNPKNFELTYETLSIAENADFLKYRIEFEPVVSTGIPVSTGPFRLEMAFLINEGLKVDVSTGLILDFNLADPKYYFSPFTKPDPDGNPVDSVTVTKSPNTGNVTPSINLMLNAYKRSSLNFKPGISVGFGVSNDIRFRLYAGPSLIIGRKERIMFSSGVAFGSILRHADGYDAGKKFAQNASLPAEVPMIQDKFKFGWYFGIGFNLSGKDTKGFVEKIKFN